MWIFNWWLIRNFIIIKSGEIKVICVVEYEMGFYLVIESVDVIIIVWDNFF